eukprot:TRINITY_DN29618_c0_g1_i1.p1 TRINITY_DN29618_c0_g1~~TRINITY_DN29618_c0_g1_i1.p1  ORF type:complete len:738 (+),score=141.45 TRINITY_DN29618_c0_g1_i1:93-2306(+)
MAATKLPSAAGADTSPLVWESFLWGLISAVSLNIGSVIGVTCLPGQKARAVMMSFGGGALLFALSIELFGNVLEHSRQPGGSKTDVWAMEGSAVVGGIFFAVLNNLLNGQGAALRKRSTTKSRFDRLRSLLMRRLAFRLLKIPFFSVLSLDELKDLIQTTMYKDRYSAGDVIMSGDTRDNGIYFILSGTVQVELLVKSDQASPAVTSNDKFDVVKMTQATQDPPTVFNSWDLGTNQIFGEMCLLAGSDVQVRATAKEKTKVLVLPGHEVARLILDKKAVQDHVSLRAVERLRQVRELRHLPDHALASLSTKSSLRRFQAGQVVFEGPVHRGTPIICLVLGSVELQQADSDHRRTLQASCLLCTEHLKTGVDSVSFKAVALETTSVLFLNRDDINDAIWQTPIKSKSVKEYRFSMAKALGLTELPGEVLGDLEVVDVEAGSGDAFQGIPELSGSMDAPSSEEGMRAMIASILGWDDSAKEEDHIIAGMKNLDNLQLGQVTDQDIEENGCESGLLQGRSISKSSRMSLTAPLPRLRAPGDSKTFMDETSRAADGQGMIKVEETDEKPTEHPHGSGSHRAVMIWLGILIDAVPESLVIGIIINKSVTDGNEGSQSTKAMAAALPFVIGVFLSNLPESMSSSGSMKAHGMRVSTILLMWLATTVLTAFGAALGAVIFPPGTGGDQHSQIVVSSVEGLAAGAMLTMIAQTMMPEAFEQGGDIVGLSCLAGFLSACSVKLIPV